ncbi:MAG: PAS domain S-box protein [Deltaproteobacteria bacterium]|nr:PAS domain S-box protein [Deltaproteobacteria bacterium]
MPDAEAEADQLEYRELFEAAPDGFLVVDPLGTIVRVNQQTERMFGYARSELLGSAIENLIPERFRAQHPQHVARYVHSPRTRPMGSGLELSGLRRDGTEFPIEISLSPISSARGPMVAAAIRDVSDRKRFEEEARRANAYLLSSVDSIQDAFSLYDEADRIVLVNSAFRQLLGPSMVGVIVGRRFEEVVGSAFDAGLIELRGEPAATVRERWLSYHRAPSGALELETRDGRALRIIDRTTAERGTVSLIIDVTEDRLRADELRSAREQAEAASNAKSEFLASMSHELRTPMNAVLGFAQLLQRDRKQPLSERQQERIAYVLRGGEHLLKLIDEVLDLSRIEAGGITISAEPVVVREVLDEVASTLEALAARTSVQLALAPLPAGLPTVKADRTRLAQILMNFGSNAIKYNRPQGHVTFRVTHEDAFVRLSVIDDGVGIPADKLPRIFEPFQRAGQEIGPIEGTGIGLAISKRLAELMSGRVGFTSQPDRGSTFWVEVPVDRTVSSTTGATTPKLGVEARSWAHGSTRKLIYVEDNPSNIAFMRDLMEELHAVELITAPTAEIGLALIRAHQPAVVIMDINLPGMSGFDAVKQLKSWPETRDIPVIALTAAALARDTSRAGDAGFHRYLTKPVKVDELTAVLEELLG